MKYEPKKAEKLLYDSSSLIKDAAALIKDGYKALREPFRTGELPFEQDMVAAATQRSRLQKKSA